MNPLHRCCCFLLLAIVSGCSHYHLGSPEYLSDPVSLRIAPVQVEEPIAGVAVALNRELREAAIRNRNFTLTESEQSLYSLSVVVKYRERESLARRSKDTGLSDVLRLELVAAYKLEANSVVVKQGELSVDGQIFRDSGFVESSRQRIPSLLRELADDILNDSHLNW